MSSALVFSQVKDKEKKSVRIPAEILPKKKDSALIKVKVAPKLKKENDKSKGDSKITDKRFVMKETKRPFSITEKDGLKSPSEIYEKRWNKEAEKGGIIRTMSDQFLGEHNVDTKFVNIVCRDHEYPDGDRVQIQVNGYIVKANLLLTNSYRRTGIAWSGSLPGQSCPDLVGATANRSMSGGIATMASGRRKAPPDT